MWQGEGVSPPVVSIDGVIVDPAHATISVLDRGLLFGDGCFEVLRTWSGVAVDLDAHLDRLLATAAYLRLRGVARAPLAAAVEACLAVARSTGPRAAPSPEHRIRIVLTRGEGGLAPALDTLGPGRAIVIVEPLGPPPAELAVAIVDWPLPRRAGHGHKTLAYLDHLLARELARAAGADEALRLDAGGDVVEGATCNVFAIAGGVVMTPPTDGGVLPGVVRARVLALCAAAARPTRIAALSVDAVRAADELFVTSSLRGIVPVTRLDGQGRPQGPLTHQIALAYATEMHARGSSARTGRPSRDG